MIDRAVCLSEIVGVDMGCIPQSLIVLFAFNECIQGIEMRVYLHDKTTWEPFSVGTR